MARRPRRHFTPAFKAEVVDMIRTSGKSTRAICRDLKPAPVSSAHPGDIRGPAGVSSAALVAHTTRSMRVE